MLLGLSVALLAGLAVWLHGANREGVRGSPLQYQGGYRLNKPSQPKINTPTVKVGNTTKERDEPRKDR